MAALSNSEAHFRSECIPKLLYHMVKNISRESKRTMLNKVESTDNLRVPLSFSQPHHITFSINSEL